MASHQTEEEKLAETPLQRHLRLYNEQADDLAVKAVPEALPSRQRKQREAEVKMQQAVQATILRVAELRLSTFLVRFGSTKVFQTLAYTKREEAKKHGSEKLSTSATRTSRLPSYQVVSPTRKKHTSAWMQNTKPTKKKFPWTSTTTTST